MRMKEFERLNDPEIDLMLKAPILVCILIAGADGTIDNREIKEAIAITRETQKSDGVLTGYFRELTQDFEDKLKITIQGYPYESTQRNPLITEELAGLNAIWARLDKSFAQSFYKLLLEIAEKIASSSGGLLGINSVGSEEAELMRLSMIRQPAQ